MNWEHIALWTAIIFFARFFDVTISVFRMLCMVRGRKRLAAFIAFFESLIFIILAAKVIRDISQPAYVIAYCIGFSAGNYAGMWLEEKYIKKEK